MVSDSLRKSSEEELISAYPVLDSGDEYFLIDNVRTLESERAKIGRELHDGVSSLLAVANIYISLINTTTEKDVCAKSEATAAILEASENIRQISYGLVIAQDEDFDLPKIVSKLVDRINGTALFTIQLRIAGKKEMKTLSYCHKLTVYRIIQEQLNNIIKYSKASLIKIDITCVKRVISLIIRDNGVGFEVNKQSGGIGLINIKKRVKEFNGFLEIKSSPQKGCLLHVSLKDL